jgi:hypothetical protein
VRLEAKRVRASSRASGVVDVFAGAGAHAGHNTGRLRHLAVGENGDLQGSCADEFDGADGALRVLARNVNHDDFGPRILQLAQNGVGWSRGKYGAAEYRFAQARRFQTNLQRR